MSYTARVNLLMLIVYPIGILGFIPAWVLLCYKTRSYVPFLLGGSMWWTGLHVTTQTARLLAKEADINGN